MPLIYIIITLFLVYGSLVIYYWYAWVSIPKFIFSESSNNIRFSVIIPARNEEENIERLLHALKEQSYPPHLFEIIVIDDHSTDSTAEKVKQAGGVKLISLHEENINSYKKKAIETGIAASQYDWIVTTDADCKPGPEWLQLIASHIIMKEAVFIAAPVSIDCNPSFLQVFQAMDFMVLQVITGAVVNKGKMSMCNGANIAYSKKVFNEVNGFAGIDDIASGDDMLLMYKIWKKYPGKVHYLKAQDAIVLTGPMKTLKTFFNQRVRWASKAKKYEDKRIFPVLLLVYLFNLSFLVLLVAGIWFPFYWIFLLGLWLAKTLVELPLFWSAVTFFQNKWAVPYFLFFQPLHIIYTIVSGFLGQRGHYVWKGRRVR